MPSALAQALTELDGTERGFVLGALLAGAVDEPTLAAALSPPSRERCEHALAAIAALERADRVRLTGLLARAARAVSPAGIDSVHPDHLRAALDEESVALVRSLESSWDDGTPTAVRATVANWVAAQAAEPDASTADAPPPGPASSQGALELLSDVQRAVFAGLAEVPPPWQGAAPHRWSRQLTLMDPAVLLSLITEDRQGTDGAATATGPTVAGSETLRHRARALGARLAREETGGLGAAAQALAVAQRLPPSLGDELVKGAEEQPAPAP